LLTKSTYNRIAAKWTREHNTPGFWEKEFEVFKRLLPGGKVLDVGCGPGKHSVFLQQAGYDYVGVDYSEGLLEIARSEFPNAKFIEGDILHLPFRKDQFDGFWAAASLLHIPKGDIGSALNEIKRVVKEDSIGFIALKKGDGERVVVDEEDSGDQRFFSFWQKEEFQKTLEENDFEVLEFSEHPTNRKTTWLVFFVKV